MKGRVISSKGLEEKPSDEVLTRLALKSRDKRLATPRGRELVTQLENKSIDKKEFETELKKIQV